MSFGMDMTGQVQGQAQHMSRQSSRRLTMEEK